MKEQQLLQQIKLLEAEEEQLTHLNNKAYYDPNSAYGIIAFICFVIILIVIWRYI
ncbi:MAG: hypothetical protein GY793_06615 [Proteobacteria bacterium]|nr:hypothetical protein [Pseudomonadota bacterium]